MAHEISRRQLLSDTTTAVVIGAAAATTRTAQAKATGGQEVLHEFAYGDVRLTGGPIGAHYDFIHAHYVGLDPNQILKVYRQHAGLDAPGADMGGWYDASGFVPGHAFGQIVSGLARIGAGTGDPACHERVRYLVDEFRKAVDRNSNPYAGPNAEKVWAAYILDKHEIGLIDAYRLSGVHEAADLLPRVIAGAKPFISPVSRDRIGKKDPPYDETYVLSENLFDVATVTGDQRYHALAKHYLLDKELYDPLAAGQDVLPAKHAYSHAISLSSAAKAYLVLGDAKYKNCLINAWRFLELQRYASGGWGPEEQFITPHRGELYNSLYSTKAHFETPCGSYANTKLARYLLRITGDAQYGDGLERDLFNTILATRKPDNDGNHPYYSTYSPVAHKEYYPYRWPCCGGTLVQTVSDYPLDIYFHAANKLYVNLYTSSEVRWKAHGQQIVVAQQTNYPVDETVTIQLQMKQPARFALNLRIPGWIAAAPTISVNGTPVKVKATPSSFAAIDRMWKNGDKVELTLPQSVRTIAIDDKHPNVVAVMKGPVMFVALDQAGTASQQTLAPPPGLAALPMTQQDSPRNIGGRPFIPFYLVDTEKYDTYFQSA